MSTSPTSSAALFASSALKPLKNSSSRTRVETLFNEGAAAFGKGARVGIVGGCERNGVLGDNPGFNDGDGLDGVDGGRDKNGVLAGSPGFNEGDGPACFGGRPPFQ
jgi:hypothetical protein